MLTLTVAGISSVAGSVSDSLPPPSCANTVATLNCVSLVEIAAHYASGHRTCPDIKQLEDSPSNAPTALYFCNAAVKSPTMLKLE